MAKTIEERNSEYAENLAKLIRIETVSNVNDKSLKKFRVFHKALREMFPALFEVAEAEDFEGSLLLRWSGNGKTSAKKPILLMSHHDVVEASGKWQHEAFSGDIVEGKLLGKGNP